MLRLMCGAWAEWAAENAERGRRLNVLTTRIKWRVAIMFMDQILEGLEEKLQYIKVRSDGKRL